MTQQFIFDLYCFIVVGLIANALIGWEIGKKGWIRLGLEGQKNKKVTFALFCFIGMMVWQSIGKLEFPLNSWESISFPMCGLIVFLFLDFLLRNLSVSITVPSFSMRPLTPETGTIQDPKNSLKSFGIIIG